MFEISIEVFDEFSGDKVGQKAIEKSIYLVSENYDYNIDDALVKNENRNHQRIDHLLKK